MADDARYTLNPVAVGAPLDKRDRVGLSDRYDQFIQIIPERIALLEGMVRSSRSFREWKCDWTPESVGRLDSWLAQHVTARPRGPDELAAAKQSLGLLVPIPEVELSDVTWSFVYDVAMYLSVTLCRLHPHLRWSMILDDERNMEFGEPILVGFPKRVPLNPVRIVANVAYSVVRGTARVGRLEEVFKFWSARADSSGPVH